MMFSPDAKENSMAAVARVKALSLGKLACYFVCEKLQNFLRRTQYLVKR